MRIILFILFISAVVFTQDFKNAALEEAKKIKIPAPDDFEQIFHLAPINQDTTDACWSFSTLSMLESDLKRRGINPPRLAMMYPVYYGFIEKTKRFIEKKGDSRFYGGDLFSGVLEIIKQYGIVPFSVYEGDTRSCSTFNHDAMFASLDSLIKDIKANNRWDVETAVKQVTQILNKHLGEPPQKFVFENKTYTPKSFMTDYLKLNPDEYVTFTSFSYAPFNQNIVLDVPDNWARLKIYYNLPLDEFYQTLKDVLQKGYSVAIDGDTQEPGRIGELDICFIPSFDIASENIDQDARDFRFDNGATTDVHLMHIVGFTELNDQDWFLVKDSWRSAWYGKYKGYYMMRGDYVKLKILAWPGRLLLTKPAQQPLSDKNQNIAAAESASHAG